MAAFYLDEGDVWRCPKHPSKRRRTGICPVCLKDRLSSLCPDCANLRPCSCCSAATTSSSSSSSSSFSLFSADRISNLIDSEPAFRRSKSVGIPFLRSGLAGDDSRRLPPTHSGGKSSSFWSVFRTKKSKKSAQSEESKGIERKIEENYSRMMMLRSRSVSVPIASDSGISSSAAVKGKGWYFPSPIQIFRQSKISTVFHERSPLYRG